MTDYETKDSGERREFKTGFVRDTRKGKPACNLLLLAGVPWEEQPLYDRAMALTRGADKYEPRNYEKGLWPNGDVPVESDECEHYKASLLTHAFQLACGMVDEDHAAAVGWNADMLKKQRQADAKAGKTEGPIDKSKWDACLGEGGVSKTYSTVDETHKFVVNGRLPLCGAVYTPYPGQFLTCSLTPGHEGHHEATTRGVPNTRWPR